MTNLELIKARAQKVKEYYSKAALYADERWMADTVIEFAAALDKITQDRPGNEHSPAWNCWPYNVQTTARRALEKAAKGME